MQNMITVARTDWAGVALLAHECGHHWNDHLSDNLGSRPPKELEADTFAGFAVARLGGSLDDALALFHQMPRDALPPGQPTHPRRADRLQAAAVGWRNGRPPPPPTPPVPPSAPQRPEPLPPAGPRPPSSCTHGWASDTMLRGGVEQRQVRTCVGGIERLRWAKRMADGTWQFLD
jgi:hypothetical protein